MVDGFFEVKNKICADDKSNKHFFDGYIFLFLFYVISCFHI